MNGRDYLKAGRARWKDAVDLLRAEKWEGACYLAGYAAECILKYVIFKHKGFSTFGDLMNDLHPSTIRREKTTINGGIPVTWYGKTFTAFADLENEKKEYHPLKKHKVDGLIEVAHYSCAVNPSQLTTADVHRECVELRYWDAIWRYGEPNYSTTVGTIDKQMAVKFFRQINWLIRKLSTYSGDARVTLL